MPTRAALLKRVEDHFLGKGCRVVERSVGDGFVRFRCGGDETVVRVVDELASRDEMLATIIQAALDSGAGKIAYVSIPMGLVSRLGDYAFRVNKIGVLVYDERDLVEVVEGGLQSTSPATDSSIPEFDITAVLEKIDRLEALYEELARKIENIETRVMHAAASQTAEKQETTIMETPRQTSSKKTKKSAELPSFIEDNPWVELLSGKK
ncbi:MAG: hypothetical protein NZ921_04145 [Candidatus Caldarchaeum sp.]|nr:hypothetical protein [Candidatus Caldarchaeum sp.]